MSSGLTESITIQTNISLAAEWESLLTKLSQQKRLLQKYITNEIAKIHAKYASPKEQIKNEIKNLDDQQTTGEYQELMSELREIENQESQEIDAKEQESSAQEGDIQLEIDGIESRLEAVRKDTESLKETRKQNQERAFGYFKT